MTAPDSARDEARPIDAPIRSVPDTGAAGPPSGRPGSLPPPDMAEIMPSVGRIVLGLARGAELFLDRIHVNSPVFLPRASDGEDDRTRTRQRYDSEERVDWQRRDSVEAARLANVLSRLLEHYRVGLRDLTEAEASSRSGGSA